MAGDEVFTTALYEVGGLAVMKTLGKIGPSWASTMARIDLAGKLARPAAGAAAIWIMAQPWDDEQITKVWNDWRTVNLKLMHLRTREWDGKLQAIKDAWPEGEDRKAFDEFAAVVYQEIQQFETAAMQMAAAVQNAQSDIHKIVNNAGIMVDVLLGLIILSELFQLVGKQISQAGASLAARASAMVAGNPATLAVKVAMTKAAHQMVTTGARMQSTATATKDTHAMLLMGTTVNAVTGIMAALIFSLGNLSALHSADNQFPRPQANLDSNGNDGKMDFDDIRRRSVQKSGSEGWSYI
ncbi:hypothetical protein [Nonomuraea rhodomycinica]|uniref:Uncharacterized protein n=1 Tax=Nonomuraea rhodomycinica TaxID=1712872 RepID=A0A7Y6MEN6_9ACTN|nr:hypothetical protein [Nonomuraea rhodomycinica]NUW43909.1 hypothetical protein [Nonomuraea rhodomycinica]